jgi:hypothetical protein
MKLMAKCFDSINLNLYYCVLFQENIRGLKLDDALEKVRAEFEVGENEDLNTLGEVELHRKKAVMEHEFKRTRLKPGDPGFEYDKRVEFPEPCQASEWDEEPEEAVDDDDENFWD